MARQESTATEESLTGLKFLYRPGTRADCPVVVLVHGRAGNRQVMWTFERLIPEHCHVISLEAFLPDPLGGWSWWDVIAPGSKKEAIVYAAHKLRAALEAFIAYHALHLTRLVGVGFSQGSALVSAASSLGFIPFDAIGILAGFVYLPEAGTGFLKVPDVFIAHGTQDETIVVDKARRGVEALKGLGVTVRYVEEDVGHKLGIQGSRALKDWLHAQVNAQYSVFQKS